MRRTGLGPARQANRLPRRPRRRFLVAEHLLPPKRHPLLRVLLGGTLVVAVTAAGISGFLIGAAKDAATLSESTAAAGAAYYTTSVSNDEALNQRIEKINVQQQVTEQSQEIDKLQNQIDNAQKNILDALMQNLATKLSMSSRATTGYKTYIAQAKSLITLNSKIVKFSKTEAAATVDISSYTAEVTSRLNHIPTLHPIPGVYTGYGWRIHPVFGYRQFHSADDIRAPRGTPIKAAGAGTVTKASYDGNAGNFIIIDHGNGFETYYMHCSVMNVHVGQRVSKGQIIGKVGSTGDATGPHLHFEVHYHGTPFNPTEVLLQW